MVRMEPHEEQGGMMVYLGAEFYPPAAPPAARACCRCRVEEEEEYEPQPYVEGQPTIFEPNPPPAKPEASRRCGSARPSRRAAGRRTRRPRRKKPEGCSGCLICRSSAYFRIMLPRPAGLIRPRCAPAISFSSAGRGRWTRSPTSWRPAISRHQTRVTLTNIRAILEACGATLADVVKCSVFLKDASEFKQMNEVYAEFFRADRPARTTIEAKFHNADMLVEIDCVAYKPK